MDDNGESLCRGLIPDMRDRKIRSRARVERALLRRGCSSPESRDAETCELRLGSVPTAPACGMLGDWADLITFNTNITHLGDAKSAIEDDIGFIGSVANKEE